MIFNVGALMTLVPVVLAFWMVAVPEATRETEDVPARVSAVPATPRAKLPELLVPLFIVTLKLVPVLAPVSVRVLPAAMVSVTATAAMVLAVSVVAEVDRFPPACPVVPPMAPMPPLPSVSDRV